MNEAEIEKDMVILRKLLGTFRKDVKRDLRKVFDGLRNITEKYEMLSDTTVKRMETSVIERVINIFSTYSDIICNGYEGEL